jgi:hypothetical protein
MRPVFGQTAFLMPLRTPHWLVPMLLAVAGCQKSAPAPDYVSTPDATTTARDVAPSDSDAAVIDALDADADLGDATADTAIDSAPDTAETTPIPAIPDPFADAAPFAYVAPDATSVQAHAQIDAATPGSICFGCHYVDGGATPLEFAGTVAFTADGGPLPPAAEIRLVDPSGQVVRDVFSDSVGNFWSLGNPSDLPSTFYAGIRNARGAFTMPYAAGSACTSYMCHASLTFSE